MANSSGRMSWRLDEAWGGERLYRRGGDGRSGGVNERARGECESGSPPNTNHPRQQRQQRAAARIGTAAQAVSCL